MNEIANVKNEVKLKQRAEMVLRRNESGLSVLEWCARNRVNVKTYPYRLKRVRQALCSEIEHHDIVPVRPVISEHCEDAHIRLSYGDIMIELPDDFNDDNLDRIPC